MNVHTCSDNGQNTEAIEEYKKRAPHFSLLMSIREICAGKTNVRQNQLAAARANSRLSCASDVNMASCGNVQRGETYEED